MLSAACRRGLRAPVAPALLRAPVASELRGPVVGIPALFGVPDLLGAPSSLRAFAADATGENPTTTAPNTTPNLIGLNRMLSQIASSDAATFDLIHKETLKMRTELMKAEADHANAISQCKFDVWDTSCRVVLVGGAFSFLFIALHML